MKVTHPLPLINKTAERGVIRQAAVLILRKSSCSRQRRCKTLPAGLSAASPLRRHGNAHCQRRQKRKPTTSADAMEEEGGMAVFLEPSQAPDEALEHTELQHAVDAAIAALPEKARLAVQLRRFENMPYEEIARALDMTVPATKSLLFRARNMLKEALASFLS